MGSRVLYEKMTNSAEVFARTVLGQQQGVEIRVFARRGGERSLIGLFAEQDTLGTQKAGR